MKYFLSFLSIMLLCVMQVQAQEDSVEQNEVNEVLIEATSTSTDAEVEYDFSSATLQELKKHPLHLNTAGYEELKSMGLLSDVQVNAIIHYRQHYGELLNIYELQAVPYLYISDIKRILPYVKVGGDVDDYHVTLHELLTKGKHQVLSRYSTYLETPAGYLPPDTNTNGTLKTHYEGSQARLLFKYRYTYGNYLSYGITAEKDAGEQFFKGTQKQGFDSYSAHLFFRTNTAIKAVALGDYEIKIGQGLMYFNGYAIGKSPLVLMTKKNAPVLKPFTSNTEFNFLRGAAATIAYSNFSATPFISYKKVDGNITVYDSVSAAVNEISALQETGYHRTLAELADKNALTQTTAGINVEYEKDNLQLGAAAVQTLFSAPVAAPSAVYSQYNFSGSSLFQSSLNYSYVYKNINVFGETAMSGNGGLATVNGLLASIDPRVDVALMYRNFQAQYQSLYAQAFAEGSTPANEKGLYAGLQFKLGNKWMLSTYGDLFQSPWLRYRVNGPSSGSEYLVQLTYKPSRYSELYIRTKQTNKMLNPSADASAILSPAATQQRNVRVNAILKVSPVFILKSRAEFNHYINADKISANGYLVYQEAVFKKLSFPFSFATRFALFSAETYDVRIYAFENDVQGSFSVPGFYGNGTRFYATLDYTINRQVEVWLRYARTWYADASTVGSGLDLINKNQRNELKLQVIGKF